jgi:hypothetical protein
VLLDPLHLLAGLAIAVVAAALVSRLRRRRRSGRLASLAAASGWMFSHEDRFDLAPRIAGLALDPGAADVVVNDVLYHRDEGGVAFVFSVHYTLGVIRSRRRVHRVAAVREGPRDRVQVAIADPSLAASEQYRGLVERLSAAAATPSASR